MKPKGRMTRRLLYLDSAARPATAPTPSQAHKLLADRCTQRTASQSVKAAVAAGQLSLVMLADTDRNCGFRPTMLAAAKAAQGFSSNAYTRRQVPSTASAPPAIET